MTTNRFFTSRGYFHHYIITSGVWSRVRARALRAPVFFGLINMPKRALRAPPPAFAASLILIYPPKLFLRPELRPPWVRISIHWAKLHPSELHCIYWVTLHPNELHCTLLSYGYTPQPSWELMRAALYCWRPYGRFLKHSPGLMGALWNSQGTSCVLMTAPWEFLNTLPSLMGALKK